jgi:WD40 repeat protein
VLQTLDVGEIVAWSLSLDDKHVATSSDFCDKYSIKIWSISNDVSDSAPSIAPSIKHPSALTGHPSVLIGHPSVSTGLCGDSAPSILAEAHGVNIKQAEDRAFGRGSLSGLCWVPNTQYLVTGSSNNSIYVWANDSNDVVAILQAHSDAVQCVSVSPCGLYIAAGGGDHTVSVWRRSGNDNGGGDWILCCVLKDHNSAVHSVCFCDTDTPAEYYRLVTAANDDDSSIFVYDGLPKVVEEWAGQVTVPLQCAFKLDNSQVTTGNNIQSQSNRTNSHHIHASPITSMRCNPVDGNKLLVGSSDNIVRLWDLHTKTLLMHLDDDCHTSSRLPYKPVAWHPSGFIFATGCANINCLKVYDVEKNELFELSDRSRRNMMSSDYVSEISWSACGSRMASCSAHGYIRVWDVDEQALLILLEGHNGAVLGALWNADNKLASCGQDGTLRVWDSCPVNY